MTHALKSIYLSTAVSNDKRTTNGYKITELYTLRQLLLIMNREAVASGLFSNGHRHSDYLRVMGNVYFIDIDTAPSENEQPYYQIIEEKLKQLHISFVSVPSKSADQYPYKRHIAVILDSYLPTAKKAFKETALYILETIGIDLSKIDERVAFNNISFLAPASINKNFINYNKLSTLYSAKPLEIPIHLKGNHDKQTTDHNNIKSNHLVKFADGSTLSAYNAKKLISKGDSKSCYCPVHTDSNPSATFYHNSNGSIKIFCGKCGDVSINTAFIPAEPKTPHSKYNYSIIIDDAPKAKINALVLKIGNYSHRTEKSVIWVYSVQCISDIYQLLLAKMYLVGKGFSVSPLTTDKHTDNLLSTTPLSQITKNITLPTPYIPQGIQKTEHYHQYKQIADYIFKHYLFVETSIYATYQNIIAPSRTFNDTCNLGLAYFEYVLQVQSKEKNLKQKGKTFPMKIQGGDKTKITQKRINNMARGKEIKMTVRQRKLLTLLNSGKYIRLSGKQNISAIGKKLGVSTHTVYKDLEAIETKKREHTNE